MERVTIYLLLFELLQNLQQLSSVILSVPKDT